MTRLWPPVGPPWPPGPDGTGAMPRFALSLNASPDRSSAVDHGPLMTMAYLPDLKPFCMFVYALLDVSVAPTPLTVKLWASWMPAATCGDVSVIFLLPASR